MPSFLGFRVLDCAVSGGPVLSLREVTEEASFRGTVLSPPQCPLLEPGSPSLDLLCDLRPATCPLRLSLFPTLQ